MKHYGDICRMNGAEIERVECVIGGSPCQDLSVAGKRAGLAGERSGLFMEQIRLIKEMRARDEADGRTGINVFPRFMVWENVIGAFSSNGGEDFRTVLEETCRVAEPTASVPRYEGGRWTNAGTIIGDGYSVAWRTHDAKYWGVPQRRRRISLVADFNGTLAPEILFERDSGNESESEIQSVSNSVSWDFAESGSAREDIDHAGNFDSCVGTTGGCITFRNHYDGRIVNDQSLTLDTCGGGVDSQSSSSEDDEDSDNLDIYGFPLGFRPENVKCYKDTATTLCNGTRPGFTAGVVFDIRGNGDGETVPTITGDHGNRVTDYTAACVEQSTYQDVCGTLSPGAHPGSYNGQDANNDMFMANTSLIRRLTPLEATRCQGFPDGWVDLGDWTDENGKKHKESDSPKYKALGNSIALPFWYWLLKRISDQCTEKTMGSLFDGIGGFSLCWQMINGDGSCRWSSEIEPFCIAVTTKHFGDEEKGIKGDWMDYVN